MPNFDAVALVECEITQPHYEVFKEKIKQIGSLALEISLYFCNFFNTFSQL